MVAKTVDLLIVGGGLAGLAAAAEAETQGIESLIVDCGMPEAPGSLGGFAAFSGAKFSLAPAGSGLAPVVGGQAELIKRYEAICREFSALGFQEFQVSDSELAGRELGVGEELAYRSYHSILLTPRRIQDLLSALTSRLTRTTLINSAVSRLSLSEGSPFGAHLKDGSVIKAKSVIVAAGRLGAALLELAGVPQTRGKGIDVGVRLGFEGREPVAKLRELGPDAKFMADGVRTFCLNSPGRIFHYPGLGFSLPGGVVAEAAWPESNVAILARFDDRQAMLDRVAGTGDADEKPFELVGSGESLGWTQHSRRILGDDVIGRIDEFVRKLASSGIVSLPPAYAVHYPLFDWHWPVFSLPSRLATGVPGVLAAGDASGHARGLMQAVVMGKVAVQELIN